MWDQSLSDERRDVSAVAPDVEQKSAEIGGRTEEHEKKGLVSECRHNCVSLLVFQNRGVDLSLERRPSKCLRFRYEGGNAGREIVVVEPGRRETLDEQPVFS